MTGDDERLIGDYLRRLGWALQRFTPADRADIRDEIGSHLAERALEGTDALARAIEAFGPPARLGRRYADEYELAGAVGGGGPLLLLGAVLRRAGRSAAALASGFASLLLFAVGLALLAVAIAKPIVPDQVGAWRTAAGWQAGLMAAPPVGSADLLGGWIVPLAAAMALGCYLAGTTLLRQTGGRLLRRA